MASATTTPKRVPKVDEQSQAERKVNDYIVFQKLVFHCATQVDGEDAGPLRRGVRAVDVFDREGVRRVVDEHLAEVLDAVLDHFESN